MVAVLWPAGRNAAASEGGGVTGPKNIGVRELTYRLAFLASSVQVRHCRPPAMPIDPSSMRSVDALQYSSDPGPRQLPKVWQAPLWKTFRY